MMEDEMDFSNMQPINNGRKTEEAGFKAKQIEAPDDSPLNDSWKNKGPNLNHEVSMDVNSREMYENRKAVDARRAIEAILGEDNPSYGGSSNIDPYGGVMGGNGHNPHPDQTSSMSYLMEDFNDQSIQPARKSTHNWQVNQSTASTRGGKQVRVWIVEDMNSEIEYKRPFRIEEAAEKIANILNQTGNFKDPRIIKVLEAHDRYMELLKKKRVLKGQINEGRDDLKPKYNKIREHLDRVGYVLGI